MKQEQFSIGREKAIELYNSNWWEKCSPIRIAEMGLRTIELCLPFHILHKNVEKILNRPVYTHEFAKLENILSEFYDGEDWEESYNEIYRYVPGAKEIIEG